MLNSRLGALVIGAASAVLVLLGAHRALAQDGTQKNPLALVKSLKCSFPIYSVGSWKSGDPQGQVKEAGQFSLTIDEIDTDSGSGRVNGTSGPVEVTALLTVSSLHFMERSVTGTLNVTTVFVSDAGVRKLRAVHSRHDYLPMSIPGFVSEPTVSQHYGTCEASQ